MADNNKLDLTKIVFTPVEAKQFQENMGKMYKILSEQMREFSSLMLESMETQLDGLQQFSKAITNYWQREGQPQLRQIAEGLRKLAEVVKEDAKFAAPLLAKANFWFTPSMPLGLLRQIRKLAESDITDPEKVEAIIVEFYGRENCSSLREMVESWSKNKLFVKRMFIIKDAFDAHVLGKYTLSIPALIPQIEGLLSSIIKQPAGDPTRIFKNAIEKEYTDFLSNVSKDILLDFATSPILYGGISDNYFTTERLSYWLDQKGIKEEQLFNRAAILHGVQINYATIANSLRVFLLLDVVYWITRKSDLS